MDNSADDYRIQSFDLDTQMLLKTALKGQHVLIYRNFNIMSALHTSQTLCFFQIQAQ